jgi:hypothetical protein
MKVVYEGVIGGYSFQMVDGNTIEVWSDFDNERPESFIFLKDGVVKSKKDFDMEISYWYLENVG